MGKAIPHLIRRAKSVICTVTNVQKDSTGKDLFLRAKGFKANHPCRPKVRIKSLTPKFKAVQELTKDWATDVMRKVVAMRVTTPEATRTCRVLEMARETPTAT